MKMVDQDHAQILRGLAGIGQLGAKAEALAPEELLRLTLPIRAHSHALEPDILLILGGRGAGKSHLFRVINLPDGPASRPAQRLCSLSPFPAKPFCNDLPRTNPAPT
jgi:hypothetical protein